MKDTIYFSVFSSALDKNPKRISLTNLIDKIKCSPTLKTATGQYRKLKSKREQQLYKKNNLPAITVSGIFEGGHAKSNLVDHNGIIQIDIDFNTDYDPALFREIKESLTHDPYTFLLYTSVSGMGIKIFAIIPKSRHLESFEFLKSYYIKKYQVEIDSACKDVGRLCFLCHDPGVYFNGEANKVEIDTSALETKAMNMNQWDEVNGLTLVEAVEKVVSAIEERNLDITEGYKTWLNLGFALSATFKERGREFFHRISKFNVAYNYAEAEKQYDSCLASKGRGITISTFFMVVGKYGLGGQKDGGQKDQDEKQNFFNKNIPLITRVENFLGDHFLFRRNIVNEKLECRKKDSTEEWRQANENAISRFLQKNYFNYSPTKTSELLNSDFVTHYNPIVSYFESLPPWDSENDISYIEKLSKLVKVKDQERFERQFRKMLIRCVACSTVSGNTNPNFNKHVFVLVSPTQSSGKSTFCRYLCPPALHDYFVENILFDKDGNISLAQAFLINLDELASLSRYDNNHLKTFISRASINERLPYGRNRKFYPRRANFVGSTNNLDFLVDETGNVRWICFIVEEINFNYSNPDNPNYVDINLVWAEAYARFKNGEEWQLTTQEKVENDERNREFQIVSEEEEILLSLFEPGEKGKDLFLINTEILKRMEARGYNTARLSQKKLGSVLVKHGFPRGEERKGKNPLKGYYVREI